MDCEVFNPTLQSFGLTEKNKKIAADFLPIMAEITKNGRRCNLPYLADKFSSISSS